MIPHRARQACKRCYEYNDKFNAIHDNTFLKKRDEAREEAISLLETEAEKGIIRGGLPRLAMNRCLHCNYNEPEIANASISDFLYKV